MLRVEIRLAPPEHNLAPDPNDWRGLYISVGREALDRAASAFPEVLCPMQDAPPAKPEA
jgi:hypothetical protein